MIFAWFDVRSVSLRDRLRIFVACVGCALVANCAVAMVHEREVALNVARRDTANLAEALADQASDTLEAAGGTVLALGDRVEIGGTGRRVRDDLRASMEQTVLAMPRLHALVIIGDRGHRLLDNSSAEPRSDLDYRSSEFFAYHRSHSNRLPYISGPLRSQTEAMWLITVTRRIDRADGRFAGVVVAEISVEYFRGVYKAVDVGRHGVITLYRDGGTVLVRQPGQESYIGRTFRSSLFRRPLAYQMSGTILDKSPVDGVLRLNAFRRLDAYPLVVLVALAESEILAAWRADALIAVLVQTVMVGLLFFLGSILSAQIEQRKLAQDALAQLALVDALTGIANRRQFDATLDREWRNAIRKRRPLSLLMLDVDNFKSYNDTYGHAGGDEVLQRIAATLAATIRPADLGARFGGEEFAVVLPDTDCQAAVNVAERIREAVVALQILHAGTGYGVVTLSIGLAGTLPHSADGAATLLATADRALYMAKDVGRNATIVQPWNDRLGEVETFVPAGERR